MFLLLFLFPGIHPEHIGGQKYINSDPLLGAVAPNVASAARLMQKLVDTQSVPFEQGQSVFENRHIFKDITIHQAKFYQHYTLMLISPADHLAGEESPLYRVIVDCSWEYTWASDNAIVDRWQETIYETIEAVRMAQARYHGGGGTVSWKDAPQVEAAHSSLRPNSFMTTLGSLDPTFSAQPISQLFRNQADSYKLAAMMQYNTKNLENQLFYHYSRPPPKLKEEDYFSKFEPFLKGHIAPHEGEDHGETALILTILSKRYYKPDRTQSSSLEALPEELTDLIGSFLTGYRPLCQSITLEMIRNPDDYASQDERIIRRWKMYQEEKKVGANPPPTYPAWRRKKGRQFFYYIDIIESVQKVSAINIISIYSLNEIPLTNTTLDAVITVTAQDLGEVSFAV